MAELLAAEEPTGLDRLGGVRFARSSSAPLLPDFHREFERRFGLVLLEAMGSTEAGGAIFSTPLPPAARKVGSPGLAVGFEVRIVSPSGADLSPGEEGAIGESSGGGCSLDPTGAAAEHTGLALSLRVLILLAERGRRRRSG